MSLSVGIRTLCIKIKIVVRYHHLAPSKKKGYKRLDQTNVQVVASYVPRGAQLQGSVGRHHLIGLRSSCKFGSTGWGGFQEVAPRLFVRYTWRCGSTSAPRSTAATTPLFDSRNPERPFIPRKFRPFPCFTLTTLPSISHRWRET